MAQGESKKEALFNEVKGSLFEYLVAKKLARASGGELVFHQSLDPNYLTVLSQQDRMVRQFYPEMLPFLEEVSSQMAEGLTGFFGERPESPRLTGKFSNSDLAAELDEADLLVNTSKGMIPVSLKLNKRHAYVNTKSAGIKSFFSQYFGFISTDYQSRFGQLVELEFLRMAAELHELHEMEFPGNFSQWTKRGFSELPGELSEEERVVLKAYYARLAREMHAILKAAFAQDKSLFARAICPLMGFSRKEILQAVCFHDFKQRSGATVEIHPFSEIEERLPETAILPFAGISSVEVRVGHWALQIRIKPMNKFTTTAIKINCSVKVGPSRNYTPP